MNHAIGGNNGTGKKAPEKRHKKGTRTKRHWEKGTRKKGTR
jgi:hypothetical protein